MSLRDTLVVETKSVSSTKAVQARAVRYLRSSDPHRRPRVTRLAAEQVAAGASRLQVCVATVIGKARADVHRPCKTCWVFVAMIFRLSRAPTHTPTARTGRAAPPRVALPSSLLGRRRSGLKRALSRCKSSPFGGQAHSFEWAHDSSVGCAIHPRHGLRGPF